jgi:hypothetical protein
LSSLLFLLLVVLPLVLPLLVLVGALLVFCSIVRLSIFGFLISAWA